MGLINHWLSEAFERIGPAKRTKVVGSKINENPTGHAHHQNTFSSLNLMVLLSIFVIWFVGIQCAVASFLIEIALMAFNAKIKPGYKK